MVRDVNAAAPDAAAHVARLAEHVKTSFHVDALAAAQSLLGSTAAANLLLIGAAYQSGALPMSAQAIEQAIHVNGVAVEANLVAFRWGRAALHDPQGFAATWAGEQQAPRAKPSRAEELLADSSLAGETRRLAALRADLLIAYQGRKLASRYLVAVENAWKAERNLGADDRFSTAVARGLHKLMAYKDEYEVARLLTDAGFLHRIAEELPGADRVQYRLHPPALRALGLKRKLSLGAGWRPVLRALAHGKRLRGTPLDPFGRAQIRVLERELLAEYETRIADLTSSLSTDTYDHAVAVADAAELIRGYEDVKTRSVGAYRQRLRELDAAEAKRKGTAR
jgi:indolepyruvate ferredoxin oxidoreductase